MKEKTIRNLKSLEYLINSCPNLFHDGIDKELLEIIKDSKNILNTKEVSK